MADKTNFNAEWVRQGNVARQRMANAVSRLETAEVTGTAGNGAVTLVLNATGNLRSIKIAPSAAEDVKTLERLILEAHEEAYTAARQMANDALLPLHEMVGKLSKLEL
jgi:DNA-binding protein YbaB